MTSDPAEALCRGRALAAQEKHEDALQCFDAAALMLETQCRCSRESSPSTPPPPNATTRNIHHELAEALVGKGVALGRLGRTSAATAALESALEQNSDNTTALSYLGLLRVRDGRLEDGVALYRRALEVEPGCPLAAEGLASAWVDEGTRLKNAGQTALATAKYRAAAAVCPGYASAHYNLGIVLAEAGDVGEAICAYTAALRHCPAYPEAHNNLGVIYKNLGRLPEAVEAYRRCLQINPNIQLASQNLALALSDLGTEVKGQGRLAEAIGLYQQALFHNPRSADAMYNLGVAYAEGCEPEKACVCYELAAHFNPRCAEALNNLGVLHKDLDNLPRALACYEAALRIRPTFPEALNNMGVIYTMMCSPDDALAYFHAALQVQPTYAEAYTNLGKFYQDSGDAEKAVELYDKCLSLCPLSDNAAHNRLLALNYSGRRAPDAVFRAHLDWGRGFRARAAQQHRIPRPAEYPNARDPDRRLRIGYISPDLNTHSVAYFFEAALAHRSPDEAHVTCYYAAKKEDATTRRLRGLADAWRPVCGQRAHEVAEAVRRDGIDVLVELAGHTAGNRLDVMALSPAPVQVTWIGYPNTTGLEAIRYRLTDARADPPGAAQPFTEELVRLPDASSATPPPSFGSFNNVAKVNSTVVGLWARILSAVPDSRFLFKSLAVREVREACAGSFAACGIDRARIDMNMVVAQTKDHLDAYARMDISLDTFPYAGTTTTCEALFMGVPVVTLRASGPAATHAQNVGVSILTQVGLEELIANDEAEYVAIAVRLAGDRERVAGLRR
eukprot:CAMPEP_0172213218 /NCGR_PEP_ID=MMETSP1050-20130122/37465_1 /TAXON_ID=233186 /ORGANISM="Cryptomonas curvata, Strain CCAP979/52" /LENGTH=787 /DNA_ID=CAMNT_0012894015 /DNA_START=137 /DNA_END=2497 /DNA_ORIENTATION=-